MTDPIATAELAGASLKRCLTTTYTRLVEVFGQPGGPVDEDKSHVEWTVQTPHGAAGIYDYGDCHECGPGCPRDPRPGPQHSPDLYIEWHIGAHNHDAAEWVAEQAAVNPTGVSTTAACGYLPRAGYVGGPLDGSSAVPLRRKHETCHPPYRTADGKTVRGSERPTGPHYAHRRCCWGGHYEYVTT